MSIIRVYVDGYNLYAGGVRWTRFRWLDVAALADRLAGKPVQRVIYCTAMCKGTKSDPEKPSRQEAYWAALRSTGRIEIMKGLFQPRTKSVAVKKCRQDTPCLIRVKTWEEKGSDVNLGARLVHDGHFCRYEHAIVVSGDSDLVEPIRLVTEELHRQVTVFNPRDRTQEDLQRVATNYRTIRPSIYEDCQLPDQIHHDGRVIHKPAEWSEPPEPSAGYVRLDGVCGDCGASVETVQFLPCPHFNGGEI